MLREKDTREIVRGIRFPQGKVYSKGSEDELEAVLTTEQYTDLSKRGYLAGDWKPGGTSESANGGKAVAKMNKDELTALASENDVEVPDGATKAQLLEALKEAGIE